MRPRALLVVCAALVALAAPLTGAGASAPAQEIRPAVPQQPARDTPGTPTTGTAALIGQVVHDDASARPIRRAIVNLSGGNARMPRMTMTDDAGQFVFPDLPSGSYSVSVSKPAYVAATYKAPGARGASMSPITLTAGQRETITIRMMRGAVITGVIRDGLGQPVPNVRVQVMSFRQQAGQRMPGSTRSSAMPTDDQGRYRVFGLAPGDYVVATASGGPAPSPTVTDAELRWAQQQAVLRGTAGAAGASAPPPAGPTMGFSPVFFPGTADYTRATVVTLGPAEERSGIDLPLAPVVLSKITGTLVDPSGQPPTQTSLTLTTAGALTGGPPLPTNFNTTARSDPSGKFLFSNVPPGRYAISVRIAGRAGGPGEMPPPPPPQPFAAAGGGEFVRVISSNPVAPGTLLWALVDVDVNGSDITDIPVTLQRGLELAGRLLFEGAAAPPDLARARVSVQPLQPSPMGGSVPAGTVNPDGTFLLKGATPGRYRLSATVPSSPPPQAQPPQGQPQDQTRPPQPQQPPQPQTTQVPSQPAWTLKSVLVNGRDALDFPIEMLRDDVRDIVVTFSDKRADLEGTLFDASGKPAPDYSVAVFSADRAYWVPPSRRVRSARSGTDGRFRFVGLPPGEYLMIAIADVSQFDWTDPAMLEQLAPASFKFAIAEGEKKTQNLKLAGG